MNSEQKPLFRELEKVVKEMKKSEVARENNRQLGKISKIMGKIERAGISSEKCAVVQERVKACERGCTTVARMDETPSRANHLFAKLLEALNWFIGLFY